MKYDDASWHYGGDFPSDLPKSAGSTHIAMFLAWAMLSGLASEDHLSEFSKELAQLKSRVVNPVEWFTAVCDEKFTDEDLTIDGNAFVRIYYRNEPGSSVREGGFFYDYSQCFSDLPSLYHVPADWKSYDRIAPILSQRLRRWRQ